jgi:hypothetical protein
MVRTGSARRTTGPHRGHHQPGGWASTNSSPSSTDSWNRAMKSSRAEGVTINAFASPRRLRSARRWRRTSDRPSSTAAATDHRAPRPAACRRRGRFAATARSRAPHLGPTRPAPRGGGAAPGPPAVLDRSTPDRIVDPVTAVAGVDLLVHRQPNGAAGLKPLGIGRLPGAGQAAQQVHDGWHAEMLSRRRPEAPLGHVWGTKQGTARDNSGA